jgi:hypothetical protein
MSVKRQEMGTPSCIRQHKILRVLPARLDVLLSGKNEILKIGIRQRECGYRIPKIP